MGNLHQKTEEDPPQYSMMSFAFIASIMRTPDVPIELNKELTHEILSIAVALQMTGIGINIKEGRYYLFGSKE